ncbi:hypothetical protein ACVBEQ_21645 [Nakamurella sp. GG22]
MPASNVRFCLFLLGLAFLPLAAGFGIFQVVRAPVLGAKGNITMVCGSPWGAAQKWTMYDYDDYFDFDGNDAVAAERAALAVGAQNNLCVDARADANNATPRTMAAAGIFMMFMSGLHRPIGRRRIKRKGEAPKPTDA